MEKAGYKFKVHDKIELGKAEILKEGKDITIVALGKTVARAMELADKFEKKGISIEVINLRFLKPLDNEKIIKSALKTKNVITIEDGYVIGGMGNSVVEALNDEHLQNIKIKKIGYPDKFVKHGNVEEIEKKYNLDLESLEKIIDEEFIKNILHEL